MPVSSPELTEEEKSRVQDVFEDLDTEHQGVINFAELRTFLRRLGLNVPNSILAKYLQLEFCRTVHGLEGDLSYNDLIKLIVLIFKNQPQRFRDQLLGVSASRMFYQYSRDIQAQATAIFNEFDVNKSGYLELEEFKDLLECYWLKVDHGDDFDNIALSKFKEATQSDVGISLDEFLNYYNTLTEL